jgi:AmiR/NasT family two-component response regulator
MSGWIPAVNENFDHPLRVLIVENEAETAVLLHEALREAGLVVVGPGESTLSIVGIL